MSSWRIDVSVRMVVPGDMRRGSSVVPVAVRVVVLVFADFGNSTSGDSPPLSKLYVPIVFHTPNQDHTSNP